MSAHAQTEAPSGFRSLFSLQGEQYANDANPGSRIDLNLSFVSGEIQQEKTLPLPATEAHFFSFYESGVGGDYSADIDQTVGRFSLLNNGYLWVGRTHPLYEATEGSKVTYVDAIGANWAQNQSDALNPRVSGWTGIGAHVGSSSQGFSVTTAFSPLFLPSFGPRLQLSQTDPAQGSRFSRLPPQFVHQGNATLPLRYDVNVGNVSRILFQPQAFVSAGYAYSDMRVDFMDWTAPDPAPDVDTDFALVTHTAGTPTQDSADVMVSAHPLFRRQHFTGARYAAPGVAGKPVVSATYEWFRHEVTASLQSNPVTQLNFGVLNRWAVADSGPAANFSPSYANKLVWGEVSDTYFHERIRPSFRVEQHLASQNWGRLIRPKVDYEASKNVKIFALAQVMSGRDYSYFGEWRSLGSAALGVNWLW